MQDSTNTVQNINEINIKSEPKDINIVPDELLHIIPVEVWSTLSIDQKKQELKKHGLYEKYFPQVSTEESIVEEGKQNIAERQDVIVTEVNKPERFKGQEFETAVSELNKEKQEEIKEVVISSDDKQRIIEETASNQSNPGVRFFGYQPSNNTISGAKQISDDNPVSDSKTWAATLIAKILGMFQ